MTAGMQLQVLRDLDRASAKALITRVHQAINAVHDAPFPTIAMVNGACLGAGFELAMACDLCVAASDARLGLPEIRVGVPSVIEAALLPGLVGPARAAELLFTGESIPAERALAWGLVNRVVPPAELRAATGALAREIAGYAPTALRLQKRLVIQWRTSDLRSAVAAGIEAFAETYATEEPREATSAYLEKRPPRFR
jgi:enoyl-CoA hydratase